MGPVLTDPWFVPDAGQAEGFEQEAADEVGPGHPLSGHTLTLIACAWPATAPLFGSTTAASLSST